MSTVTAFDLKSDSHRRLNILTGEWILVSPHRSKRPWQGQLEDSDVQERPEYDEKCYLCPGNDRAQGVKNPDYRQSFVFENDFAAILNTTQQERVNDEDLLVAQSERGICKVISFTPRHDLTLPEMSAEEIQAVIDLWQEEFKNLSAHSWIKYIQIFENKGSIMGCSNPHPHGQIWAQQSIPAEITKETLSQKNYFAIHRKTLLSAYLNIEIQKKERIVIETAHFVVVVPFWATWPYETMIISKRQINSIQYFSVAEKMDMAKVLKRLTTKYDNLFNTSFPYSAGMHQAPVNSGDCPEWHWHMHFYPPLLRSASVKKFMVGYELLANPQRDITPEFAAEKLRALSEVHYKSESPVKSSL